MQGTPCCLPMLRLLPQPPKKALKAFLKQKPLRSEMDVFKANLISLLNKLNVVESLPKDESEEHLKNYLRDFLRDTYYRDSNAINTKDKKDLVINLGKGADSPVGVIIEAKRPTNVSEMISVENPNRKALHELVLYYLKERLLGGNNELKQLVVTNIYEWYIFDANHFDKLIFRNTRIRKLFEIKVNDRKDNPFFYEEVARIIAEMDVELPCIYFNIRDYETILRNNQKEDDKELVALFKTLSPGHLLKIVPSNDSNTLNAGFYRELLHIIGLEEARVDNKNIIRRKIENPDAASLIELTIEALETEDPFHRIGDLSLFGENREERKFNIALELCITWINRILFLKLLEGQLVTYHQGNKGFRFLDPDTINDFDELFKLFHKVLAVNLPDRTEVIQAKYGHIPYLNSSLFEISPLEDQAIKINSLDNSELLGFYKATILKEEKKKVTGLPTLAYLLQFLDAYDFASEGSEGIQEDTRQKQLINASVLGKVFEKINGYKDGSIFTPGFITMYMSREAIRLAVTEKFNQALAGNGERPFDKFDDIRNYTSRLFKTPDVIRANEIVNSLRICDPAVGSGHFLVSALNEIIAIKAELGILADENGNILGGYEVEIVNDELIITDQHGNPIDYRIQNGKPLGRETQRVQKTLFREKQTIIENCLFGVDINPKSVLICRLRLWIELLKNAYYKEPDFNDLETLPNIDINIKCGNSLLSRFNLDADLGKALKSIKYDIKAYRAFVNEYKNARDREVKKGLQKIIDGIKTDFRTNIDDPFKAKISKARGELTNLLTELNLKKQWGENIPADLKKKLDKASNNLAKLEEEKQGLQNNLIFRNAFEWRFEFPEVLNNQGEFEGFDVVIGNPPYIRQEELGELKNHLKNHYQVFAGTADLLVYFFELALKILRPGGQMSLITSNKFVKANYGKNLRRFLLQHQMLDLIDFGELPVFEEAATFPAIFHVQKGPKTLPVRFTQVKSLDFHSLQAVVNEASELLPNEAFGDDFWSLGNRKVTLLLEKIRQYGIPLGQYTKGNIYRGVLTGFNQAFIIDEAKRNELVAKDPRSAEIIFPFAIGDDVRFYQIRDKKQFIIFTRRGIEIEQYPAIIDHLLPFKAKLTPGIKGGRKPGPYKWFEIQDTVAYYREFEKPKIVYPVIAKEPRFAFSPTALFSNDKTFFIPSNDLYLLGYLNSSLAWFYLKNLCSVLGDPNKGGRLELRSVHVSTLPVFPANESQKQQIESLVSQILALKEADPEADVAHLQNEIDQIIYGLYGLGAEEIGVVKD